MPHTNVWDDTYPQDTENAGLGASRIRGLKDNIQDRMKIMHTWGESADYDGEHKYDKVITATISGSYSIDLRQGRIFFLSMSADTTLNIGDTDGISTVYSRSFLLFVKQHSSNVYTLTFPSSFKFHNGATINVTAQANWVTVYQCLGIYDGSTTKYAVIHVGDFAW